MPKVCYRCEYVNCGKCKARCAHGPYWYAYWREGPRIKKKYIGKTRPAMDDTPPRHVHADWEPILCSATASPSLAFRILDLPWPSPWAAVKAAYRRLAMARHPDRGGDDFDMKCTSAAYSYLAAILGTAASR